MGIDIHYYIATLEWATALRKVILSYSLFDDWTVGKSVEAQIWAWPPPTEFNTIDNAGVVGGGEQHRAGDLVGVADATYGDQAGQIVPYALRLLATSKQFVQACCEGQLPADAPTSANGQTVIKHLNLRTFAFGRQPLPDEWPEWGRKADVAARPVVALQRAGSSISASAPIGSGFEKLIVAPVSTPRARPRRNNSESRIHGIFATLS